MSQTEYKDLPENRRHPYRRLEGGLSAAIYAGVTLTVLSLIAAAWYGFIVSRVVTVSERDMIPHLVLALVYAVSAILVGIWTARVAAKNAKFLRSFEISAIALVPFGILTFLLGGYNVIGFVCYLAGVAVYFLLGTAYFRKSVRVRTYFNSGEYMKKSLLFNKTEAPLPAAKDIEEPAKLERTLVSKDYKPVTIVNSEKPKVCPACGGQNYADEKVCACGEVLS